MSEVKITMNTSKLDLRLEQMPQEVHDALVLAVTLDAGELQGAAQARAEELLQVRSGKFVRSIKAGVRQREGHVTGRVSSKDPRAGLFEWGGHTPPHEIAAKNAQALLLQMQSGTRFAAHVDHPGGEYKALQILQGAFDEMKSDIAADLEAAVRQVTDGTIE
jgi:hypothetical protein